MEDPYAGQPYGTGDVAMMQMMMQQRQKTTTTSSTSPPKQQPPPQPPQPGLAVIKENSNAIGNGSKSLRRLGSAGNVKQMQQHAVSYQQQQPHPQRPIAVQQHQQFHQVMLPGPGAGKQRPMSIPAGGGIVAAGHPSAAQYLVSMPYGYAVVPAGSGGGGGGIVHHQHGMRHHLQHPQQQQQLYQHHHHHLPQQHHQIIMQQQQQQQRPLQQQQQQYVMLRRQDSASAALPGAVSPSLPVWGDVNSTVVPEIDKADYMTLGAHANAFNASLPPHFQAMMNQQNQPQQQQPPQQQQRVSPPAPPPPTISAPLQPQRRPAAPIASPQQQVVRGPSAATAAGDANRRTDKSSKSNGYNNNTSSAATTSNGATLEPSVAVIRAPPMLTEERAIMWRQLELIFPDKLDAQSCRAVGFADTLTATITAYTHSDSDTAISNGEDKNAALSYVAMRLFRLCRRDKTQGAVLVQFLVDQQHNGMAALLMREMEMSEGAPPPRGGVTAAAAAAVTHNGRASPELVTPVPIAAGAPSAFTGGVPLRAPHVTLPETVQWVPTMLLEEANRSQSVPQARAEYEEALQRLGVLAVAIQKLAKKSKRNDVDTVAFCASRMVRRCEVNRMVTSGDEEMMCQLHSVSVKLCKMFPPKDAQEHYKQLMQQMLGMP